jgi:hypothetical protein
VSSPLDEIEGLVTEVDGWAILGTGLDVAPTGDTLAAAWAEAAQRAGEGR